MGHQDNKSNTTSATSGQFIWVKITNKADLEGHKLIDHLQEVTLIGCYKYMST
jgi:hypothetical protein